MFGTTKKRVLYLLLTLALILSLAACGSKPADEPAPAEPVSEPTPEPAPEPTPEPTPEPEDPQILTLFALINRLDLDTEREWRYAVTDLDHNGRYELIAASQHQADRSTTLRIWEVGESLDAASECAIPLEEGESFPDILSENADTYHDAVTDRWSYMFYDNILLSETEAYTAKCAVSFMDRTLSYKSFAFQTVSVRDGRSEVSFMDLNGGEISPEDYNAAGETAFAGAAAGP